jgi:hypothetical protein
MDDKDRMFADMADNNRINQAKQLALIAAKIAVLGVGIHGKGILGAIGKGVQKGPNIAGTTFDVGGKEAAKQAAAKTTAGKIKDKATTTLITNGTKEGFVKKAETTIFQKTKKIPTKEIKNMMREGIVTGASNEVKKSASKAPGSGAALKIVDKSKAFLSNIAQGLNSFKHLRAGDPNGAINFTSGLLLGEWNLTHGTINYANNVLRGKIKPGRSVLKAQASVSEMTLREDKINNLVKNNLDILKKAGVKNIPEKFTTKHAQDTFMKGSVSKEISEKTAWSKNLEEYKSLRKEINQLGPSVRAINRGSLNINEEKEKLREITLQQELKYEQLKTLTADEGLSALLANKTAEEVMTRNFIIALNFQNLENKDKAFRLIGDFQGMDNRKTLIIADCQAQLNEGVDYLDGSVTITTSNLLKETKNMLSRAKREADEDGDEEDINRMRKA